MPTEAEIKQEMLAAIGSAAPEDRAKAEQEIDEYALREDTNGKKVLQTFYKQWQKAKKKPGSKNPWNSTAAYLLGITKKQPVGSFFFTKRRAFARPSPPDIDSDFDYEKRHLIIDYLVKKYGRGRVANIGTYQELKMRSCITRIVKALDIAGKFGSPDYTPANVNKVTEILDRLPRQRGAVLKAKDEDGEEHAIKTTKDAYQWCKDFRFYMDKYPEIMQHTGNIEGLRSIFGCVAADTPILTQKGWVRIDQMDRSCAIAYLDRAGERIFTKKYIAIQTGTKLCYRMRLTNGCFVDLTDEHVVFTDTGCVEFRKIRENPKKYKVISVNS